MNAPVTALPARLPDDEKAAVVAAYRDYLARHRPNDLRCPCAYCRNVPDQRLPRIGRALIAWRSRQR